jgi:hypothetical protein
MNWSKQIGRAIATTALAVGLIGTPRPAHAIGSEGLGNSPLGTGTGVAAALLDLANLKIRAYWREVNGDYHLFYRGDASAMNEALGKFALIATGPKEIIIRPGPGQTTTFQGEPVAFDFELHIPGGLYAATLSKVKTKDGADVFGGHPRLILFIARPADLDALRIPAGLSVVDLGEQKRRYLESLDAATAKTGRESVSVRGYSAFSLGELGPIGPEVVDPLLKLVDDKDPYTRACALSALGSLGASARLALPALIKSLDAAEGKRRPEIEAAISAIEKSKNQGDLTELIRRIHDLRQQRMSEPK